ncbi:MAG TPA: hypothetical protein VJ736_04975 [Actinomycetota bacterium]|jgi:hypothetical protein|nr:hypothetical protein [Actinomycetota bacterium]
MRRLPVVAVALAFVAAVACTNDSPTTPATTTASSFMLQMGSGDLYAGTPQRVQVGVFNQTADGIQLLTGGSIPLSLVPADGGQPIQGTAHYVPAPGTTVASQPTLTSPSKARGVYELENVTFPSTGVWTASLSFTSDGHPQNLTTDFGVSDEPALPAPGQRAFATKNLTMADANAKPESIDSRAQDGAKIPDPELHQETIAAALAAHQPILALFSTPVWCMSQFCGPSTDALEQLAGTGPQDAAYIHVEIYEDHATNQVNAAAKQWLLRNGSLTEPWLFLIAPDGKIVDRWSPLFQVSEVRAELDRVAR